MAIHSDIRDQAYQFFIQEAPDLLQAIEAGLLTLSQDRKTADVHQLMRAAHSLKGGASSVGLEAIAALAHRLENIFKVFYDESIVIDSAIEHQLFQAYDCLRLPLRKQIETGSFDAEEAIAIADPIFRQFEERYKDALAEVENYVPTSEDLGMDMMLSIFEVDVARGIERLAEVTAQPYKYEVAGELRAQVDVFEGFAEILNLKSMGTIAEVTKQALEKNSDRALEIAQLALRDFECLRAAVLSGDRAPSITPSDNLMKLSNDTLPTTAHPVPDNMAEAGIGTEIDSDSEYDDDFDLFDDEPLDLDEYLDFDFDTKEFVDKDDINTPFFDSSDALEINPELEYVLDPTFDEIIDTSDMNDAMNHTQTEGSDIQEGMYEKTIEDAFRQDLAEEDLTREDLAGKDLTREDLDARDDVNEVLAGEALFGEDLTRDGLAGEVLFEEGLAPEVISGEDLTGEGLAKRSSVAGNLSEEDLLEEDLAEEDFTAENFAAEYLAGDELTGEDLSEEDFTAENFAAEYLAGEDSTRENFTAEEFAEEELAGEDFGEEDSTGENFTAEEFAVEELAGEDLGEEDSAGENFTAEEFAAEEVVAEDLIGETLVGEVFTEENLTRETLTGENFDHQEMSETPSYSQTATETEDQLFSVEFEELAFDSEFEDYRLLIDAPTEELERTIDVTDTRSDDINENGISENDINEDDMSEVAKSGLPDMSSVGGMFESSESSESVERRTDPSTFTNNCSEEITNLNGTSDLEHSSESEPDKEFVDLMDIDVRDFTGAKEPLVGEEEEEFKEAEENFLVNDFSTNSGAHLVAEHPIISEDHVEPPQSLFTNNPVQQSDNLEAPDLHSSIDAIPVITPPVTTLPVTVNPTAIHLSQSNETLPEADLEPLLPEPSLPEPSIPQLDGILEDTEFSEEAELTVQSEEQNSAITVDVQATSEQVNFSKGGSIVPVSRINVQLLGKSTPVDQTTLPKPRQQRSKPSPSKRKRAKPGFTTRVDSSRLERMNNLVGELAINREGLALQNEQLQSVLRELLKRFSRFQTAVGSLREVSDKMLVAPERFGYQSNGSAQSSNGEGYPAEMKVPLSLSNPNIPAIADSIPPEFDPLEMDRYGGLHSQIQGILEDLVQLEETVEDINLFARQSDHTLEKQRYMLLHLRDELVWARMLPMGEILNRFPRVLRDLSRAYHKPANLRIIGTGVLVDKGILEKLYDPLLHLLRNAFDHGIEPPALRQRRGKPAQGQIAIRVFHKGNQTIVEVSDDGQGISYERIRNRILELGWSSAEQVSAMSSDELIEFIFLAGFSTARQVSQLSGRGVGLDVVRAQIQSIKGSITVNSSPGKGTSFTLYLPLTLTIAKLITCVVGPVSLALPSDSIEEILTPQPNQVNQSANQRYLNWKNKIIPIHRLIDLLQYNCPLPETTVSKALSTVPNPRDWSSPMLIFRHEQEFFALEVDRLINEQELVIKPFGRAIAPPKYAYGSAILGDGSLVPVIDATSLMKFRKESKEKRKNQPQIGTQPIEPSRIIRRTIQAPTILVVDDAVTIRRTLSLSLSRSGFRVLQARDGREAIDQLQQVPAINLVICDIEMPNMNGFEFLTHRRQDSKLSQIPTVMLTSRGNDKHRWLANQLGATAFFTKPYLEHEFLSAVKDVMAETIGDAQPIS